MEKKKKNYKNERKLSRNIKFVVSNNNKLFQCAATTFWNEVEGDKKAQKRKTTIDEDAPDSGTLVKSLL